MNNLCYPYQHTDLKVCHTDFAEVLELPHQYKLGFPVNVRRYREEPINSCEEYVEFIAETVRENQAWRIRPALDCEGMSDWEMVVTTKSMVVEWYAKHPHLKFRIYQT